MKENYLKIFIFSLVIIVLFGFGCQRKIDNNKEVKELKEEIIVGSNNKETTIKEEMNQNEHLILSNEDKENRKEKIGSPRDSEIGEWKTYKNDEVGFEFRYPAYLEVRVDILNIDEAPENQEEDNPWKLTKQFLDKEKSEILSSTNGADFSIEGNETVRRYFKKIVELPDGIKAQRYLGTDEGGGIILRYIWYRNNFRISISISKELPENIYKEDVANNLAFNELLKTIEEGKANSEIQSYFDDFEKSIATLKLIGGEK